MKDSENHWKAPARRVEQAILMLTSLGFCWLAMQAVHEFGHVLGAWLTGAEVIGVVLHPSTVSQTYLGYNPQPLVVVWAGPLVGSALPLLALLVAKACRVPKICLLRVFAGFCLIANGVYVALAPARGTLDTNVMLYYGSPRWALALFGLLTVPLGLYLWRHQGRCYGLGEARGQVDRRAVVVSTVLFLAIVAIELVINSRRG